MTGTPLDEACALGAKYLLWPDSCARKSLSTPVREHALVVAIGRTSLTADTDRSRPVQKELSITL